MYLPNQASNHLVICQVTDPAVSAPLITMSLVGRDAQTVPYTPLIVRSTLMAF